MEDFISEEKRSLEEINIAPSKQQRNTIKKIFKWFGNNEYNPSNGFSSILMVNGIAGTGKTTVLSKILFKILSKTNGIDINKNIVVAGSNEHVANALADSIGKATSNLTYGFNELMNSEIASDIKIIVFDELGALTRDQLLLLKQKIEDVNSKRQSAPVKVLALGDPNQLSKSILMEGSALNANNIDGKFDINAIKSIEALSVQYRSDVDAINEASDMFSGKSSDVYGVPAKASCNLSDVSNKNPYGIHAPKSMSDFMDRVKASMDGSRSMPIIIAYNTTSELNELNAQIPDEIKKNVQFVQMYDVQGRTLDQLFIYVKKSGVLSDLAGEVNVSKYNAAMYMLLSRATDYACVYNENGTFNQDVDGASIKNSLNKNKEQLEKSKITYEGIVTTEDKIINDGETKSKNKIDETKSKFDFVEPEIDKIDYPEIDAHADDVDDDIEAANASIDEVLEANNSVEKELFIDKDTQISQDSSLNDIDSNEKTKIKNTTASNIKRTNLKAGDDISVINAFKGDKALYLLVKEHEGKFYTVGTLSESEAKSLGISNSNFNQDYSIEERPDGVYDSISGISATKNGNEIKLKVSDVKHAKIEYKQDNKTGGAGFLNNILASVINKFGIKSDGSVSKSIFIKTLSSKDNKDMHLELGVPYMIIKWGKSGGKLYIRLEPKAFSRSNQWITYKGSNAFDALESFTLAIKGVES